MNERDVAEMKADAKMDMIMDIQRIILKAYDHANNPDMNDLFCHLEQMVDEISYEFDEQYGDEA